MVTTIAALAALWFTNQSLKANGDQYGLARQTAVTERFAKAIEQLGDKDAMDVRLGGIYLLERLSSDSPPDRKAIFEVLGSFVRGHSPNSTDCGADHRTLLPIDVQAALTVIGRRGVGSPEQIDLTSTCLANADLIDANLRSAKLYGANLTRARLSGADLANAILISADMNGASLSRADLHRASFGHTNLQNTTWIGARLNQASLQECDLRGALLGSADMRNAYFIGADLRGTIFVNHTYAEWVPDHPPLFDHDWTTERGENLRGARFDKARIDDSTQWPQGFVPTL
ncbi:pentapeptide repeat-containing protein [Nocardia sp.]|uniref:pentapeptide repeat-containing protein n=1 Tax=Nocardia sp. TaxID=1821 RepID=UPI00262BD991|nr:pentapeptide repeat-containing protein [Nocardia sp.]